MSKSKSAKGSNVNSQNSVARELSKAAWYKNIMTIRASDAWREELQNNPNLEEEITFGEFRKRFIRLQENKKRIKKKNKKGNTPSLPNRRSSGQAPSIWDKMSDNLWSSTLQSRIGPELNDPSMGTHLSARKSSRFYKKNNQPVAKPLGAPLSFQQEEPSKEWPERWVETFSDKKEFKPKIRRVTKDGKVIDQK